MSLYTATQKLLRFGFWLYYKKVHVINPQHVPVIGPVLLVANHPNSFMDALLIGSYMQRATHFLVRGDAFKNPTLAKIFKAYYMLPVYRLSEGKENIEKNFETFDTSYDALKDGGMVLIFGEGLCKNNWDLRPLKKGPGRLAHRAWNSTEQAKNLTIIPVGLTYEHFNGAGKSVVVNYGKPITAEQFNVSDSQANFIQQLNEQVAAALTELAFVEPTLKPQTGAHASFVQSWVNAENNNQRVLAAIKNWALQKPAVAKQNSMRWLTPLHYGLIALPHFWLCKLIAKKATKGSVFYDSVLFGLTLFLFPLYWITLLALIFYLVTAHGINHPIW